MKKIIFILLLLIPVSVFSQDLLTAGVSSGDTLSAVFSVGTWEIPSYLISPGSNATDSLKVQVLDDAGAYSPLYWNNSEYYILTSDAMKTCVALDPDIFSGITRFKLDMENAAGDSITYKLITRRRFY